MKKLFAILLCAGALAACTKPVDNATQLEVSAPEITVPSKPNVAQLTITTDASWHAEVSEKWVVASKVSGSGNDVIKLAVMANPDYSAREALITLSAGNLVKTVRLIQNQLDGIFIDGTDVSVSYEGGEFELPIQSNVTLTVESDAEWLMLTPPSKALEESVFVFSVELNAGRKDRVGHITVSGEDLQQVFTVTQGAFEPEFDLVDEQGVGPWGTLMVPREGITYTFTAVTNMDFYAEAPDADWITLTKEGNVVTVTIPENADSPRAEYIYMGCSVGDEDYSDYGAMIKVQQKGPADIVPDWNMDFYWGIFPQSTRVSIATIGEYLAIYSPGAITPGIHLYNKANGTELSVVAAPVENITGIANDDAGNLIVTTGGNFPINEEDWSLIEEDQIPLKVYVATPEEALAGNLGSPILTYYDGFYGYGLDNARITGNAKEDALLVMTSGAAGGGTACVAWEIRGGATTNDPTAYVTAETGGGDLWSSFSSVSIGRGTAVNQGVYFAGYAGDYNLHFNPDFASDWTTSFVTGYSWEGAVTAGDAFSYEGENYLAIIGMNYFAFSDWGYNPCTMWLFKVADDGSLLLMASESYYATESEENWQYGDTSDIHVAYENGTLYAYVMDAAASTYRRFILDL